MPKPICFLAYSCAYEHILLTFRHLLDAFGFEVTMVAEGNASEGEVSEKVLQAIGKADAVVVLLGPHQAPADETLILPAAQWPSQEAIIAHAREKPTYFFVHGDTPLPGPWRGLGKKTGFNFWQPDSFVHNVQHIVKHLIDMKNEVDRRRALPFPRPPGLVSSYRRATVRRQILSPATVRLEVYHEVVAHQHCSKFCHSFEAPYGAHLPPKEELTDKSKHRCLITKGDGAHTIGLEFRDLKGGSGGEPHEIFYWIEVKPALKPNEELGYWRSFEMRNLLPLTRAEMVKRTEHPDYPNWLPKTCYGPAWHVTYHLDELTHEICFPWEVRLASHDVRVLNYDRDLNEEETQRCKQLYYLKEDPADGKRILGITLPNPVINHSYFLLYEPAQ